MQNKQTEPDSVRGYSNGVLSKFLILVTTPMQEIPARRVVSDEGEPLNFTARFGLFVMCNF